MLSELSSLLGTALKCRQARDDNQNIQHHHSHIMATALAGQPIIHDIFEKKTGSWQYIVVDPSTLKTAIIDPVLDYDAATATVSTQTADSLLAVIKEEGCEVDLILEAHVHADHMTAASYLRKQLAIEQGYEPMIGIGIRIKEVQKTFGERYRIKPEQFDVFDKLFDDDEMFHVGSLSATSIPLPGHTPDHIGYKIGGNIK